MVCSLVSQWQGFNKELKQGHTTVNYTTKHLVLQTLGSPVVIVSKGFHGINNGMNWWMLLALCSQISRTAYFASFTSGNKLRNKTRGTAHPIRILIFKLRFNIPPCYPIGYEDLYFLGSVLSLGVHNCLYWGAE